MIHGDPRGADGLTDMNAGVLLVRCKGRKERNGVDSACAETTGAQRIAAPLGESEISIVGALQWEHQQQE